MTPNSLTIVDWFLREVRDLPLSDGEKMSTLLLLTSYSRATSAQERDISRRGGGGGRPRRVTGANFLATLIELVTPERFPDLAPLFAGGGYIGDPSRRRSTRDDDFSFGLERILDGIEYHVASLVEPASPTTQPAPLPAVLDLPRDQAVHEAAKAVARQRRRSAKRRSVNAEAEHARAARARRTRLDATQRDGTRDGSTRLSGAGAASAQRRRRPVSRREVTVMCDGAPAVGREQRPRSRRTAARRARSRAFPRAAAARVPAARTPARRRGRRRRRRARARGRTAAPRDRAASRRAGCTAGSRRRPPRGRRARAARRRGRRRRARGSAAATSSTFRRVHGKASGEFSTAQTRACGTSVASASAIAPLPVPEVDGDRLGFGGGAQRVDRELGDLLRLGPRHEDAGPDARSSERNAARPVRCCSGSRRARRSTSARAPRHPPRPPRRR